MKQAKGMSFGYCGKCENVHLALWAEDGERIETVLTKEIAEGMLSELNTYIEQGARKEAGWVDLSVKVAKQ